MDTSIQQSEEWDYSPTLVKEFMRAGLVDQVYMVDGEVSCTAMAEDASRKFATGKYAGYG